MPAKSSSFSASTVCPDLCNLDTAVVKVSLELKERFRNMSERYTHYGMVLGASFWWQKELRVLPLLAAAT